MGSWIVTLGTIGCSWRSMQRLEVMAARMVGRGLLKNQWSQWKKLWFLKRSRVMEIKDKRERQKLLKRRSKRVKW